VPIAEVIGSYLQDRGELDVDSTSEFIALVAALLVLKSRRMLAEDDIDEIPGVDPEEESRLERALLVEIVSATSLDYRAPRRHNCGMATESLRAVRDHLSEVIDRVERQHERVVITRNGRDAAVLISPEDLAELEETLAVLSDPQALADIREADAAYARDDVLRGVDAVRRLAR
jgi:prevent-host-death family protein